MMAVASSGLTLQNKILSSAYNKWEIEGTLVAIAIPVMEPSC